MHMKKNSSATHLMVVVGLLLTLSTPQLVRAEANEVHLAKQYGLSYLPMQVVVERKLIQKYAEIAGLGDINVKLFQLGGGAASNDAILSGAVDFNATGIGPLISMWAKTQGREDVRAVMPLAASPTTLTTVNPEVHSLSDYLKTSGGQIALPAVRVSVQSRILQMAAEKELGSNSTFLLDRVTVSMKNPDAFTSLMSPNPSVKSHFAIEPYTTLELRGGARKVISSYDVLGGSHSLTLLWTTARFTRDNPKLYNAVVKAFLEAMKWINENPKDAAGLYSDISKSVLTQEEVLRIITDKNKMEYTPVPIRTMEVATFMHKVGAISKKPTDWKALFWQNVHNLPGS